MPAPLAAIYSGLLDQSAPPVSGVATIGMPDVVNTQVGASGFMVDVTANDLGSFPTLQSIVRTAGAATASVVGDQVQVTPAATPDVSTFDYTVTDGSDSDTGTLVVATADAASTPVFPTRIGAPSRITSTTSLSNPLYTGQHTNSGGGVLVRVSVKQGFTNATAALGAAVTYGGVTVPEVATSGANGAGNAPTVRLFFLAEVLAPTGDNQVAVQITSIHPIDSAEIITSSYLNVSGTGAAPAGPFNNNTGDLRTTDSFNVVTTQNTSVVDGLFAVRGGTQAIVEGGGYADVANFGSGFSGSTDHTAQAQAIEVATGGATQAFDASWSTAQNYAAAAIELLGSAGAGGGDPAIAQDLTEQVDPGAPAILIDVLASTLGAGADLFEAKVSSGAGAAEVFDDGGVNKVRYTPPAFEDIATISYAVSNADGGSLATITVQVATPPDGDVVGFGINNIGYGVDDWGFAA